MAGPLPFYDRVKETATTTGTGTFTLAGASTGYQSFAAVGNGNTCYYVIAHQTLTEWECGVGTYTSAGTTLARTAITSSSNAGAAVNFSAGTKDVFISAIADFLNGAVRWQPPVGMRLSLTTNVYVTTSNVSSAGTLYWTTQFPSGTGVVTGYNGSALARKTITEKNLSLTLTGGKLYDVFYDYDGDALALSSAWTDDTTRADALANEQGAIVLGSDHTKLWLGTLYATSTNTTEDSASNRVLYNAHNQAPRYLFFKETTGYTYASATVRQMRGSSVNRVLIVVGAIGTNISLTVGASVGTGTAGDYTLGIGEDLTTAMVDNTDAYSSSGSSTLQYVSPRVTLNKAVPLGVHFYAALERAASGVTATLAGSDDDHFLGGTGSIVM